MRFFASPALPDEERWAPRSSSIIFAIFWLGLGTPSLSITAEPGERHTHNGILQPYNGAPPLVVLTPEERAKLGRGEPVYKRIETAQGHRAVAVFRVSAPADVIWSAITDFASYPKWIKDLAETEVYKREGADIYVRFRIHRWFAGSYTYYVHHTYPWRETGWGTWKLDYSRPSDLDDSVGFWRVTPVPGESDKSDVFYSADLRLKGWIPGFMQKRIIKRGLREATSWAKTQSEARVR